MAFANEDVVEIQIALGQLAVTGDKQANLNKIVTAIDEAARRGARLAVFPEASMFWFGAPTDPLGPAAEALDGPFVTALARRARERRTWVLAGMFERVDGDARVYNTLVLLDDAGELVDTYRKIHLYDAFGYRESSRLVPGDGRTLLFEIDGVRFGAFTCYDLRFPELARSLTYAGAQVLLCPAAWLQGTLKEFHFQTLARARAIENTVYVGTVGQCGPGYSANSLIADPMGTTVASLAEAEGLLVGRISTERVAAVREKNPSLANARPDLYARWLEARSTSLSFH